MQAPLRSLLVSILLLLGTSCASIVTGSTDSVIIESVPSGAQFTTNIGVRGVTPRVVVVPASQDLVVDFSLQGYEPTSAVLESRVSAWVAGNIIFGGLLGIIIDIANPDARTHDKVLRANLIRDESRPIKAPVRSTTRTTIRELPSEINIRHGS